MVAIGPVVPELAQAARSRHEAHLVSRVLRGRAATAPATRPTAETTIPPGQAGSSTDRVPDVADISDVRSALDALRVVDTVAELSPPATNPAESMLAYDAEHRTDLARTLAFFLSHFGDVAGTSRQLGIHPNTLRYRLRRVRELFSVDLDDPDMRLLAELGLRQAGLLPPQHPQRP